MRLRIERTPKPKAATSYKEKALPTNVKDLQQAIYWERFEKNQLREKVRWQISTVLAFIAAAFVAGIMLGGMVVKGVEIPPVSLRASCEVQVARLIARGSVLESRMDDTITACIEYYDGDPSLPSG